MFTRWGHGVQLRASEGLFHVKLWYKYERLTGKKIPTRIHEEYVLSEFLKSSEEWSEIDLINDLDLLNDKYRKGLPSIRLEELRLFDIENELNNIKYFER